MAFLRIASAFIILIDLAQRSLNLSRDYTDNGVIPRALLIATKHYIIPIHLITGSTDGQIILFIIEALFAVGLLVGYQTRICSMLSWILLASLNDRNFLINNGGDTYLRLILFWGMFLPWGEMYSIDSLLNNSEKKNHTMFSSLATFGLTLQICLIYFMAGTLKTGSQWINGSSLFYILNAEIYVKPLGQLMLHYPNILGMITTCVPHFEKWVPLLLVFPFFNQCLRIVGVFLIILFHLSILSMMELGIFPIISIAAIIGLLPSKFWNIFSNSNDTHPTVSTEPFNGIKIITHSLQTILITMSILSIILINFSSLPKTCIKTPKICRLYVRLFHLHQKWNLYAPGVNAYSDWWVIKGTLRNDRKINPMDSKPINFNRPMPIKTLNGERDKKLFLRLSLVVNKPYRIYYAHFLCTEWNMSHSGHDQMKNIQIFSMKQNISLTNQKMPIKREILIDYTCP